MANFCFKCEDFVETYVEQKEEAFPVLGFPVSIQSNVTHCSKCHGEVWDSELDNDNLRRAFNEYVRITGKPIHGRYKF